MAKKTRKQAKKQSTETRPKHEFQPGNPYRWKPGQCGNPNGRAGNNKDDWQDFLSEITDPRIPKTRLRILQERCYRKACQGSARHMEICLDRGWGKPSVHVETLNLNANLAEMVADARRRVSTWKPPQLLPAAIEVEAAEPKAQGPARSAAPLVTATEPADCEPQNIMEALNKPTRESRQINLEPSFGRWRH